MKKFIAFCLSLTMGCTIFAGCGNSSKDEKEEKSGKEKSTTTTTVSETATNTISDKTTITTEPPTTTVTSTSETTSDELSDNAATPSTTDMTFLDSSDAGNGTTTETYLTSNSELVVFLRHTKDDAVINILTFSNFLTELKNNDDIRESTDACYIWGMKEDDILYSYVLNKNSLGEYESVLGTVWFDSEYEDVYNSILDGTFDSSKYVDNFLSSEA